MTGARQEYPSFAICSHSHKTQQKGTTTMGHLEALKESYEGLWGTERGNPLRDRAASSILFFQACRLASLRKRGRRATESPNHVPTQRLCKPVAPDLRANKCSPPPSSTQQLCNFRATAGRVHGLLGPAFFRGPGRPCPWPPELRHTVSLAQLHTFARSSRVFKQFSKHHQLAITGGWLVASSPTNTPSWHVPNSPVTLRDAPLCYEGRRPKVTQSYRRGKALLAESPGGKSKRDSSQPRLLSPRGQERSDSLRVASFCRENQRRPASAGGGLRGRSSGGFSRRRGSFP